jgi:3-deoxy-manno-octulosonate cytidylyltransferase (CMP-KDO synthetase)
MNKVIIIPARYQSSRFPGKPLVDILGISMICRVWNKCVEILPAKYIFVATDSKEIAEHCKSNKIQVLMTSSNCLTGTDRVYEASKQFDSNTMIINVQGDEPLIDSEDIRTVIDAAENNPNMVINAMCPIVIERDYRSVNIPKVVFRPDGRLLYMSRSPMPIGKNNNFSKAWRQVCIYAFPSHILERYSNKGKKTPLEEIEDIEILRFIELGYDVHMIKVSSSSIAVDIPEDVERVKDVIRGRCIEV